MNGNGPHKFCYWFKLSTFFPEFVLCLLVQFSGFLFELAFQECIVNTRLQLFFTVPRTPTTASISVSFKCYILSILISRSLHFNIFANSADDKFLTIQNISWTNKQELFLWSLIVISGLLASDSLYVCIAKVQTIVTRSVSTTVLVYVHTSVYGMGLCNVRRSSNACIDSVMPAFYSVGRVTG